MGLPVPEGSYNAAAERKASLERDSGGRPLPAKRIKLSPLPEEAQPRVKEEEGSGIKIALSGFLPDDVAALASVRGPFTPSNGDPCAMGRRMMCGIWPSSAFVVQSAQ